MLACLLLEDVACSFGTAAAAAAAADAVAPVMCPVPDLEWTLD